VQGDLLASIEGDFLSSTQNTANASEQLTQASHSQRRGWCIKLAVNQASIVVYLQRAKLTNIKPRPCFLRLPYQLNSELNQICFKVSFPNLILN
jgi:hypothetical protein